MIDSIGSFAPSLFGQGPSGAQLRQQTPGVALADDPVRQQAQDGVGIRVGASGTEADAAEGESRSGVPGELTREEQEEVRKLKARDAEVRRHEQAHVAAGGDLVLSGPSYEYRTGPDGRRYAVGGEVQIDTSPEDDPEDTIEKAERIVRAALAPAEPSNQDRRVASQARSMALQARMELARERYEEASAEDPSRVGRAGNDSATGLNGEVSDTSGASSIPQLDRIVA